MIITGLGVPVPDGPLAVWRMAAGDPDADWETDAPASPAAPTAVAIHGITATSRAWLAVAQALDGRAELLAPDLRGRGASQTVGPPYGLDAHVADIVALLDHLELERAVVAGHSLGAFVACRLAVTHPARVSRLVLVDGGLPLPGAADSDDPEADVTASLGPVVERLRAEFPDRETYRSWWRDHPAFASSDVDPALLDAYADFDTTGEAPRLRCSVRPEVVPVDGRDVMLAGDGDRLAVPAVHLRAPRGFFDDPHPLQPAATARAWAQAAGDRRAVLVPEVNHYTIAMGAAGAQLVADEIVAALDGPWTPAAGPALG